MRFFWIGLCFVLGSLGLSQTNSPPVPSSPPVKPVVPVKPIVPAPKPGVVIEPPVLPALSSSKTVQAIRTRGRLIVALDPQFAPFALRDAKSKIVGFDVDLAQSFAAQIGVPLEAQPTLFTGLFNAIKVGRVDFAGSGITVTKRTDVVFSDVFFDNTQIFVVRSGNPNKFVVKSDLTGKQIGVRANTIGFLAAFQKLVPLGAKIRVFDSNKKALAELQIGKLESLILDLPSFEAYRGRRIPIDQVAGVLVQEQYTFALPKKSDLLPFLNAAIATWKKNGGYVKALEKWMLDR